MLVVGYSQNYRSRCITLSAVWTLEYSNLTLDSEHLVQLRPETPASPHPKRTYVSRSDRDKKKRPHITNKSTIGIVRIFRLSPNLL